MLPMGFPNAIEKCPKNWKLLWQSPNFVCFISSSKVALITFPKVFLKGS